MIHIYIYENLINAKIYIGQTNNLKKRDSSHINKKMAIDCAIKKYGRTNFSLNVITSSDSQEIADADEVYWIARARELLGRENVYNITDGGDSCMRGRKHSEISKNKMSLAGKGKKKPPRSEKHRINQSLAMKGKVSPNKGKKASEETKKKISAAQMGISKINSGSFKKDFVPWNKDSKGNLHSEETKRKISETQKGKCKHNAGKSWKLVDGKRVWSDKNNEIIHNTKN
jgi:group I intron endonuclease